MNFPRFFYFVYSSMVICAVMATWPSPTCLCEIVFVLGVSTLGHLVPSIIDGQGQRTCRSHSTQPECDKATQSDRATCGFLTPSAFDTHFTHSRTSEMDESHWVIVERGSWVLELVFFGSKFLKYNLLSYNCVSVSVYMWIAIKLQWIIYIASMPDVRTVYRHGR